MAGSTYFDRGRSADARAQAQSWVMPNVFNVGNVAKRLIWTRMIGDSPHGYPLK
jgi:hypothetical protein